MADAATERRKRRLSLTAKLNLIVVAATLIVATGLVLISYLTYSSKVDEMYKERLDSASATSAYLVDPKGLSFLWEHINTDEFRNLKTRADATGDYSILTEWMKGVDACEAYGVFDDSELAAAMEHYTLLGVYNDYTQAAEYIMEQTGVTTAYFQFMKDGVTYNLVDPVDGLKAFGSIESEVIPEFAGYGDNEPVPATVYHSSYGWLCTSCMPIVDEDTGKAVGMFCFDIDMNEIMDERLGFFMSNIIFIILVTGLCLAASLFLVRRIATRPIEQLTQATCGFCEGKDDRENEAALALDIRSNDEIGDLFHEIKAMQGRIADYAENVAKESAEEERKRVELSMAHDIQAAMLPSVSTAFPNQNAFVIHALMHPARDIGGDFYDFTMVDDDHLALLIADVSGKGIPAALFMMAVKIMISDRAVSGVSPAQVLTTVNNQIAANNPTKTFVTVWMGILDVKTGIMTCANAGHEYPWVRRSGGAFEMLRDKHGLVVGGIKNMKYTDYTIELSPGDAVFVHTDGVNEAVNPLQFKSALIGFCLMRRPEGASIGCSPEGPPAGRPAWPSAPARPRARGVLPAGAVAILKNC